MLVRRRIQTPSGAKVRSAVQPEGEVVLGASPPARLTAENPRPRRGRIAIFGGFALGHEVGEPHRAELGAAATVYGDLDSLP